MRWGRLPSRTPVPEGPEDTWLKTAHDLARERYVVGELYGGNDGLPLETKDDLLQRSLYGDGAQKPNIYLTHYDPEPPYRSRPGRVNFALQVLVLEEEYLFEKGFFRLAG
jgi:hypothetical protein